MTSRPPFLRSKRGIVAVAALVLLLFLFRPAVYRLRNRIATSIGNALGRRVSIDKVRLRLLPRPGFDLEGLVIYDDPEFSAEPMIRAQDVSAAIRFRSLFRGRLEIATLSATEPSINLVRSPQGRWNLASLLERNAQIPAAPTEKRAFERRPAFPYLEAGHARINFKIGQTKKSYALMDADVALWQDSENSWSARIKAAPVRTDFNLTDTGIIAIDGKWQRAASLRFTPVQLTVQWQNGQLGQITKLLTGKDRGWRGGINLTAQVAGTPEALMIESQISADGFHRYDIAGSENVRLASTCSGQYNSITAALSDLLCQSSVSGGTIRMLGTAALIAQIPTYDFTVALEQIPLASMLRLLRQAKKQVPAELTATGLLNAEFHGTRTIGAGKLHDTLPGILQTWNGSGTATNVRLASSATSSAANAKNSAGAARDEIAFATIPLTLIGPTSIGPASHAHMKPQGQQKDEEPSETSLRTNLRIGPATLSINASAPLNAGGSLSKSGYHFFLRGDAELKDLFRIQNMIGGPVPHPAAEGLAKLDVGVSGQWQGFAAPVMAGTAQLRNVRAEVRGFNAPIQIASANISLGPDALLMQKISAHIDGAGGGTQWSGEVTAPFHCPPPATAAVGSATPASFPNCMFQFDLAADKLSTADLAEWLTPHPLDRPWYRILNSDSKSNSNYQSSRSPLLALQARGNLHVGRLILKSVVASELASQVEIERGRITLTALRGQLLQGTHRGNWIIDVNHPVGSASGVLFQGTGTLRDISLAQVSTLMNDGWISGTADANFAFEGSGLHDFPSHSTGKLQFVMRNGSLPHIEIPESLGPGSPGPLPVRHFTGELTFKEGVWRLSSGKLESTDASYQVNGTASALGIFDFALTRDDEHSWIITGPFAGPQVAPTTSRNLL